MSVELREIPPAPRKVRPQAVLPHRWPLGAFGLLGAIYGGILTLMLWLGSQGSFALIDNELDADSVAATGVIEKIESVGGLWTSAGDYVKVTHSFEDPSGVTQTKPYSYVRRDEFERSGPRAPGDTVLIQHERRHPFRSRLAGGRLVLAGVDYWKPALYGLTLPGAGLLLLWALALLRHRRLLRDGDLAIAEVLCVVRVRRVNPTMLRVHYRFRDHQARLRDGSHWVRARSPLGERLQPAPTQSPRQGRDDHTRPTRDHRCVVVHDRHHPDRNLLVVPTDFRRARTELIGIDLDSLPAFGVADGQLPDGKA